MATYLSSFGNAAVSTIKYANCMHITLFKFCNYAMPPEDVSMWMRHRCKVKALGYKGAITNLVEDELGELVRQRAYMTMVLPQRDLRRSGSFLMTSGLVQVKSNVSRERWMRAHQVFCKNGVRPRTPMHTAILVVQRRKLSISKRQPPVPLKTRNEKFLSSISFSSFL